MIEQKVIIHLTDENSSKIGILSVSSINYRLDKESEEKLSSSITLENIPFVENPDNETPIQYCENISSNFAKLMFLEETEYQILFESMDVNASYDVLYSLVKMNDSHFKPFRFDLGDNNKFKIAGTLNFRSYVGKSFLDVRKNRISSAIIPVNQTTGIILSSEGG